jgi:hypothetical protein
MSRAHFITWTLLAFGGFALFSQTASAQDPPLPKKNSQAVTDVTALRDQRGITKEELPKAREAFKAFAKYYAEVVQHPAVWKASQEFKIDPILAAQIPTIDGPNGILRDLDRFILDPVVGGNKVGADQAVYIRELGAALDEALRPLIETHPERIVRINAARVLAHVARSGAPAYFTTITRLLGNANTPTEVKYYLFHAAAAALNAADPYDIKVRKHANDPKMVGSLIQVLEKCVTTPSHLVTGLPAKAEDITPDQLAVIGLVRRQAVRALGQVKFASYPAPGGGTLYPAHTLVRVAMSDPNLPPAPGPAEAAEAAIGICNMAPVVELTKGGFASLKAPNGYNADVAVEAVLTALVNFAGPRAANPFDRSVAWRSYAARLAEALRDWRPLFDPDYDPVTRKFEARLVPPLVEETYKWVVPNILARMDKVDSAGKPDVAGSKVEIELLKERLDKVRTRQTRKTELFNEVKQTSIEFVLPPPPPPPPKK